MRTSSLKAQAAAITGVLFLATLTVAPWVAGSHILKPRAEQWRRVVQRKDELLVQKSNLESEIQAYQNMAEKKEVNDRFQKNIDQTSIDALQGFINNGKYSIYSFKTTQLPDTKEIRFSFVAPYNMLGQMLTDLWNTFQFVEVSSLIMKPSPNKPDEDIVATLSVKMPN
jgi:hypothetical protein